MTSCPSPPPHSQRDKRMQLTWACEEQLFRQEMENADDIRLSVRLYAKCMPDKREVWMQCAGCVWGGVGMCAPSIERACGE